MRWPRWRLRRIDAALVHAVLRHVPPVAADIRETALGLDRTLLAARRRDAYAHRRRLHRG